MANSKIKLPTQNMLKSTLALVSKKSSKKVLKHFEDNFDKQGYEANGGNFRRWSKRKDSKNRKPLLRDTGRLRKSFKIKMTKNGFEIINPIPYAQYHQEGVPGNNLPARPILYTSKELDKIVLDELDNAVLKLLGVK